MPSEFWNDLQKAKPDLFLLDIMVPEEDGISILKKLCSNREYSSIPVIMLTAKDSEYDVVTGLDAGADDYVTIGLSQDEKLAGEAIEQKIDETKKELKRASRKRIEAGADVKEELNYIDIVRKIERAGDCIYTMLQSV